MHRPKILCALCINPRIYITQVAILKKLSIYHQVQYITFTIKFSILHLPSSSVYYISLKLLGKKIENIKAN